MDKNVLQQAAKLNKEHRRRNLWRRIVSFMAAIVVFCTTYALILPAITLEIDKAEENGVIIESASAEAEKAEIIEEGEVSPSAEPAKDSVKTADAEPAAEPEAEPAEAANEIKDIAAESEITEVVYLPAQTFEGETENKDVKVYVEADAGAFPVGTTMEVKAVDDPRVIKTIKDTIKGEVKQFKAVDITFMNAEGKEIEPLAEIRVKMTSDVIKYIQDPLVVHIDDKGKGEIVKQVSEKEIKKLEKKDRPKENEVLFNSDQFSVYAIVGIDDLPQPPRVTFEFEDPNNPEFFFVDKAGNPRTTQIIKNGEILQDVGLPTINNDETFNGWFIYNGDTAVEALNFDSPIAVSYGTAGAGSTLSSSAITIDPTQLNADGTFHVTVKAYFGEVVYLTFYEDAAGTNILDRVQIPKGSNYDISTKTGNSPSSELAFVGWSADPGVNGVYDDGRTEISPTTLTNIQEDRVFYPIFNAGHWLTFYAGATGSGATYTAPMFVPSGTTAAAAGAQPANPTWKGYAFQYWTTENLYTGTNGSYVQPSSAPAQFNFNSTVSAPTTLYAYWTPADTTYTVVFWKQNVTDSKNATDEQKTYMFAEQITVDGTTGQTVTASNYSGRYTGFNLNSNKSDTSVVVNADGTSIINIYFDRNLITMNFDQDITSVVYNETTGTTGTQYGYVDGQYVQLTWNGTNWVYTTTEPVYQNYTGTRYNTTDVRNNNNPQHYGVVNGRTSPVALTRRDNTRWYYDSTNYSWGTRYYDTHYVENTNGTYGFVNGQMVELTNGQYQSGTQNVTHIYEGTRYTRGTTTTRSFTGLYGQTLAQNGYAWPSQYIWTYGTNTIMSYLGQFVLPNNNDTSITFRSGGTAGKTIYFFLQNVDGTYPTTASASGSSTSNSGDFNFTNKFDGFEVVSYQLGNTGNGTTGTWTTTAAGGSVSTYGYTTLGVRFERKHYTLKYLDSVDNTELNGISNASVVYGASLSGYKPADTYEPVSQYPGKVWDGKWYKDQACSEEFVWTDTMPNADMVVYAGWEDVYYKVDVDPNGGELTSSESTFFWLTYGQQVQRYDDITRNYVEDPEGNRMYESWLRSVYTAGDYDPWDYEGYLRSAAYVTAHNQSELHEYVAGDAVGDLVATITYPDDGTRYKYEKDAYALIGWYEITFAEGHYGDLNYKTGESLYTFSGVTHDTYIQAKWRRVGDYHVDYTDNKVYLMGENGTVTEETEGIFGQGAAEAGAHVITGFPVDGYSYADQSSSSILTAPASSVTVTTGEGEAAETTQYIFMGWYYNGQVYDPGDVYTIEASLAQDKVVGHDYEHDADIIQKTIYIYPVYQAVDDVPVDVTHIYWYSNWKDTDGNQISNLTYESQLSNEEDDELEPNEAVDILPIGTLVGSDTRFQGYTFKGWARVPVAGEGAVNVTADTFNAANYMYLYWDGSDFHVDSETGQVVTEVAADENQPYHDMYAVWETNKYTVTVRKTVVGSEADQHTGFVFDPDFTGYTGTGYNTNFILAGTETTVQGEGDTTYTYYTSKTFENVPYGATLTLTENSYDDFTTTVKYTVTSNVDGTPIADPQTENSTDGATYTIHGDITIAYTNTRSTQDVEIQKVSVEDPDEVLEGAVFKISGPNFVDTYYISNSSGYLVPATVTENADGTYSYAIADPDSTVTKLTLTTGTYTLTEVKAPDGYLLMEGSVSLVVTTDEVQVEQQGNTHTYSNDNSSGDAILVKVTNTAGAELPMTGGTGTLKYTLGGLVMMAGALVYGFGLRRRRERRFNE